MTQTAMPSAVTTMVATTGRLLPFKKPSEDPNRILENLEISPMQLETADLRSPEPPHHARDYTDEMLQRRRHYADYLRSDHVLKTTNSTRFAGCYSYYVTKAQRMSAESDLPNEHDIDMARIQKQKLLACRQILMFDESRSAQVHPCDVPNSEIGEKLLTCTTVMLKYVIYTRYQYYLGRKLDSFSFAVRPELIKIWRNAYKKLKDEMMSSDDEERYSDVQWESDGGQLATSDILRRIGEMLRLKRFTIENAIRSLEKYSRHRFLLWSDGCENPEVPTYELEDLVQSGSGELLAHTLYSDFVTLDALKKFATEDIDIAHLQGVIIGFINTFFGVKCAPGQHKHDIGSWTPTTMLNVQKHYLNTGDRRFQQRLRWLVQSEAERAEKKFWKAWTALCRDDGRNVQDVQELLRTYLKTLGVPEARELYIEKA